MAAGRMFRAWQAILLVGITVVPVVAVILTGHPQSWVTAIELLPPLCAAIVLWWQFLYKCSGTFRSAYIRLLARVRSPEVRVTVYAQYVVSNDASVDQVMTVIRNFYRGSVAEIKSVKLSGSGIMEVFMPGWQGLFEFLEPLEVEYFEPGDEVRRFSFNMPDASMDVRTALERIGSKVIPLLSALSNDLPFQLESMELKFLFRKGQNPYISTFLHDLEPQSLRSLEYMSEEPNGSYLISMDSVTISATNVGSFGHLIQKHLGSTYGLL